MYRLPQIIFLFSGFLLNAQSPHGEAMKIDCAACHSTEGWEVNQQNITFNHATTGFDLLGVHQNISCIDCHSNLVFETVAANCIECHLDVHQMTVGGDCTRCHDSENWLVDNIPQIHLENGFPLLGAHAVASCVDCHEGETNLQFNRIGNDCFTCHDMDYRTAEPNHAQLGYSTNCVECHAFESLTWSASGIDHSFFPLEQSHGNLECSECHLPNTFSGLSPDCFSCHEQDYQAALQPNHVQSAFPQDCSLCHTLDPNWMPADFSSHDSEYFPIYSGNHKGEWNSCTDCHTVEGNYSIFSCIDCHEHNDKNRMDREHRGINGYVFESNACYSCHPTGEED